MLKKICLNAIKDKINISISAIPFIVSVIFLYYLTRAIIIIKPIYGTRILIFSICLSLIWLFLFIYDQRLIILNKSQHLCLSSNPILIAILSLILGLYLTHVAWGMSYLSLDPFQMLDNGSQHIDTLFHSSIAESWKNLFYPSALLNNERYLSYHTFSHLLMALLSRLMSIPSFIAYNYLFPIVFIPLYCFSILYAVSIAKEYFKGKNTIYLCDLIIICIFVVGVFKKDLLYQYAVWKDSFIISESFLIANMISFFSYGLCFKIIKEETKHPEKRKKWIILYGLLIVPIEIVVISWSKISVGFIFTAGMMYYLFRRDIKNVKNWILIILYMAAFLFSFRLFNSSGTGLAGAKYGWLAFENNYIVGKIGIWGHIGILSLMTIAFIIFEFYNNRYTFCDFVKGKTIWIELLVIQSALAFVPVFIMNIAGGSAAYFSYAIEISALILLCGNNSISLQATNKKLLSTGLLAIAFCWFIFVGINNTPGNPIDLIGKEHTSNLTSVLLEIRDAVKNNPKSYTIYLDSDSIVTKIFNSKSSVYVCPAMTGVGVINATYNVDGITYTYNGIQVTGSVYSTGAGDYLMLEDAMKLAKERGKDFLIHIINDGYQILSLNESLCEGETIQ